MKRKPMYRRVKSMKGKRIATKPLSHGGRELQNPEFVKCGNKTYIRGKYKGKISYRRI